ncbi:MlaD family protein [Nocardioides sp. C4-1]|uniref:MlaD family protein n=1 Tax=Nocardioides sp. C4-1 TaxID=3151851 RepID=UPI003263E266
MITRRTKVQLLVFVIITLLGVSFVGARYARLDKLVRDDSYEVTAHFRDAGGIFAGAEVTYRGTSVGTVKELELTDDGVDVVLEIENKWDDIPADSIAEVGNRSAVGEQFVDLQPESDDGKPFEDGSQIAMANTRIPIQTEQLLGNLSRTVSSVDQDALRTTVDELGKAFQGTGDDLETIIDTGNSFIEAADDNFDITTKLIEDSNVVLNTQIDSQSNLRTFADQLALFSGTLADANPDLERLIDTGSSNINQVRALIEENRVELGSLLDNLITTGEVVQENLPGIKQIFSIYPYVVEGTFTVVAKEGDKPYDAHFGLILSTTSPCYEGYGGTVERTPQERFTDPGMNVDARCTEPPSKSNPRGAQNLPPRAATGYARPDAFYDPDTGEVTLTDPADPRPVAPWDQPATVAPRSVGEESWKWLYLQPAMGQ